MTDVDTTITKPTSAERVAAAGRVLKMIGINAFDIDIFAVTVQVQALMELVVARGLADRAELDELITEVQAEVMEAKIAEFVAAKKAQQG